MVNKMLYIMEFCLPRVRHFMCTGVHIRQTTVKAECSVRHISNTQVQWAVTTSSRHQVTSPNIIIVKQTAKNSTMKFFCQTYHWDRNQLTHHTRRHAIEGKRFPLSKPWRHRGEVEGQVLSFLTLVLDGVNG